MIVHHLGKLWAECLPACSARIATADHPEGDSLAVNGHISVSHIALAEPDEFSHYAALLAGHRDRSFDLKVEIMLFPLCAQDAVFR
jgi:hypothetical protein